MSAFSLEDLNASGLFPLKSLFIEQGVVDFLLGGAIFEHEWSVPLVDPLKQHFAGSVWDEYHRPRFMDAVSRGAGTIDSVHKMGANRYIKVTTNLSAEWTMVSFMRA